MLSAPYDCDAMKPFSALGSEASVLRANASWMMQRMSDLDGVDWSKWCVCHGQLLWCSKGSNGISSRLVSPILVNAPVRALAMKQQWSLFRQQRSLVPGCLPSPGVTGPRLTIEQATIITTTTRTLVMLRIEASITKNMDRLAGNWLLGKK